MQSLMPYRACTLGPLTEMHSALASETYACSFAAGQWCAEDWLPVRSPRWHWEGAWLQEADHIRNKVPLDATPAALQGERASETYASMLHRNSAQSSLRVRAELAFDECMAPLITLAAEPVQEGERGHVYREHVEVVLFDQGINVWHHRWAAERGPYWSRVAWARFSTASGRRYVLEVERAGPDLTVRCADHVLGVRLALPETLYAGITGCEGTNRFYHFAMWAGG